MNILEKVIVHLITNNGLFYSSLLSQMTRIEAEDVNTAGVTIRNGRMELYWNPKFFETLTLPEARAVLEHECLHLVMDHISRKQDRDHKLWNIATDLAINQMITGIPKECITLDKFPKEWNLPDRSMAEVYYGIMYKNSPKIKITPQSGKDKDGKPKKGYKVTVEDGKGNVTGEFEIDGNGNPGNHEKWEQADGPDVSKEVVKQAVKEAVEQVERTQGRLPSGLEEVIADLLKPSVIPWQTILRKFIAATIKSGFKHSWKRPNRRYGETQKGKLADRKVAVTLAIDTSGSIGNADFQAFIAEIKNIQSCYKSDITVMECDAEVQKVYKLNKFKKVDTKFKGRGGTDFCPVFEYVHEKHVKTDVLVYFTDLWGSFPTKKPNYPTLWVTTSNEKKVPFGMVLSIPEHTPESTKKRGYRVIGH